jgi:Na+-driven multidrug efflux pump
MPATYIFMFVFERGAMGIVDGVLVGTLVPFILVALRYRWLDRQSLSQPAVSS